MTYQFQVGDQVLTPELHKNGEVKAVRNGQAYVSVSGVPGCSWFDFAELRLRTVWVNGKEEVFRPKK